MEKAQGSLGKKALPDTGRAHLTVVAKKWQKWGNLCVNRPDLPVLVG